MNSYKIYLDLQKLDLLKNKPLLWWPNDGTFEVVVGAVLTQNTTWRNVEKSLLNLKGYLELDSFLNLDEDSLKEMIKPSGFYNQKSLRLLTVAQNIKRDFGNFENFKKEVTREWLLNQKGIGKETADSILCYGCYRDIMVVDTYTKRVLKKNYDIEFKEYDEYRDFLEDGIKKYFKKDLYKIYALFHGMFVEYNKRFKNER